MSDDQSFMNYSPDEFESDAEFEYEDDDEVVEVASASQSDDGVVDDDYDDDEGDGEFEEGDYENDNAGDASDFKQEDTLSTKKDLVEYKAHSTKDLVAKLSAQTKNISSVLELTDDNALTLLQFYSWNSERLMEEYMDDPDRVKTAAGVIVDGSTKAGSTFKKYNKGEFMCFICCDEKTQTYQLSCGDEYCLDCYSKYIKDKTSSGKVIKCPNCDVALNSQDLDFIAGEGESFKLIESSIKEYVERHRSYKWCPSVDCPNVVEILNFADIPNIVSENHVPVVTCNHNHQFCVSCSFENHTPVPCGIAKQWVTKCKDDSETANWIMSNTQQCPKCDSSIEKNGGCNHMTCKKCRYEFCWICSQDWTSHGTSYYQCTAFRDNPNDKAKNKEKEELTAKQKLRNLTKNSLKKYLHYYNLYAVHESSTKLDDKRCKFVEEKVRELQETSGISWIEAQFLVESAEALLKARKVLKWSYAFAYYCDRTGLLDIFEEVQAKLAESVENLSKLFEIEDPLEIVRNKLEFLNKSHFLQERQKAMISCTLESIDYGCLSGKD
ncbi:putative E3 ubiquitin-protein ligase ARI5 [Wickerhamomyces ciferrii]|uniref:RBR-type E3 ubiquitin transferase n=1 Tax=Wickerhamomyces ciferrii (strain ATCC 14091 / BCRC 22168 / CBS 111 / JCM 3599 / NBRC 0793 / NRRL Y-1031 F-60-10) TaxID=1206466 RepID=K0KP13_WICCF|nr:putative E3 ubiquitin-protein ligase ARI5 [Wickerhamomyces ciferrii]CCH43927.1 putative E3 ubiquitin-protein ligase ARI5 [Wickerhamomyces ciferrii]